MTKTKQEREREARTELERELLAARQAFHTATEQADEEFYNETLSARKKLQEALEVYSEEMRLSREKNFRAVKGPNEALEAANNDALKRCRVKLREIEEEFSA